MLDQSRTGKFITDISINELLSGERLSVEAYNRKAEDNMVELMRDTEKVKRNIPGDSKAPGIYYAYNH